MNFKEYADLMNNRAFKENMRQAQLIQSRIPIEPYLYYQHAVPTKLVDYINQINSLADTTPMVAAIKQMNIVNYEVINSIQNLANNISRDHWLSTSQLATNVIGNLNFTNDLNYLNGFNDWVNSGGFMAFQERLYEEVIGNEESESIDEETFLRKVLFYLIEEIKGSVTDFKWEYLAVVLKVSILLFNSTVSQVEQEDLKEQLKDIVMDHTIVKVGERIYAHIDENYLTYDLAMATEDIYIDDPCENGKKLLIKANIVFNVIEKKDDLVYIQSIGPDNAISGWVEESKLDVIKKED